MEILRNSRQDQHNLGYEYTIASIHLERNTTNIMKTRYLPIDHLSGSTSTEFLNYT